MTATTAAAAAATSVALPHHKLHYHRRARCIR